MADGGGHKSVARMLLDSVAQDLAASRLLAAAVGIGDALVGFHAQQAIEKSLKAVLSARQIELRRTHDLVSSLDLLQDNQMSLPAHRIKPSETGGRCGHLRSCSHPHAEAVLGQTADQ